MRKLWHVYEIIETDFRQTLIHSGYKITTDNRIRYDGNFQGHMERSRLYAIPDSELDKLASHDETPKPSIETKKAAHEDFERLFKV